MAILIDYIVTPPESHGETSNKTKHIVKNLDTLSSRHSSNLEQPPIWHSRAASVDNLKLKLRNAHLVTQDLLKLTKLTKLTKTDD